MGIAKKELTQTNVILAEDITPDEAGLRNGLKRLIPISVHFASQGSSAYANFLIKIAEKTLPEWGKNPIENVPPEEYASMVENLLEKKNADNEGTFNNNNA